MVLGARGGASVDEDQGSDPRNTHESWVGVAEGDPWAGWLAGLADPVNSTFNGRTLSH